MKKKKKKKKENKCSKTMNFSYYSTLNIVSDKTQEAKLTDDQ